LNNSVDHIDELIGKYLAGEAAQNEAEFVEVWARENESNRKYLEHYKLIFEKAAATKAINFDADAAWDKMQEKLHRANRPTVKLQERSSSFGMMWRIAASVLLLMAIGYGLYFYSGNAAADEITVIAEAVTLSEKLPDGSDVFLNKGTELTYTFDESKKHHKVSLKGEAFFEVAGDQKNEFLIEIEGVYIKDIGTKFNVKAYPEENTIEVVVTEGKVLFYTDSDSGIYLSENGKGIYDKATKKFSVDQPEANVLSYKTRVFTFSDYDLNAVVDQLNDVYDKRIVLGDNVKNCRLTVSFNNENIDEIAAVIAETLGLTVTSSGNEIRLEGSGCEN